MNRFIVDIIVFRENKDIILKFIQQFSSNRNFFHLIVNGIEIEDTNLNVANMRLYDGTISLTKDMTYSDVASKYILDVIDDISDKDLLTNYYIQMIAGYSALRPLLNGLCSIDSNLNIHYSDGTHIGNILSGINENYNEKFYQNAFVSINGACTKCNNPFCDMTKKGKLFDNMICEDECKRKLSMRKNVLEEATIVTQEQYIYLLEVLGDMTQNSDIVTAAILNMVSKNED
ncbi:MAG: hypothetical protein ACRCTS_10245 [Fusobacteriaceae bacterium]